MSVARARQRSQDVPGARSFLPVHPTLPSLRDAVSACRGCTLYRGVAQAVFGEGSASAQVMLIGEQPGDSEDLAGKPFVGPAGKILDEALEVAGIPRSETYVTNVVKHFKFTRRGTRRIHDKPTRYEVEACRPWLAAELALVAPDIVVVLGATAAQTLLGSTFRVTRERGVERETPLARHTFATVHPASVLRAPDEELRRVAREEFFADMRVVGACFCRVTGAASRGA